MNSKRIRPVQRQDTVVSMEEFAVAYLVEELMKHVDRYLAAGRPFVDLSGSFLAAQWVDAYRAVAAGPETLVRWDRLWNLHCEFFLLGLQPPRERVQAAIIQLREQLDRLRRPENVPDPEGWEQFRAGLKAMFA